MSEKPMVAVVTTTYNMADTLPQTYASICRQTYPNFYWLLIDDGSQDNTQDVVRHFQEENKIKIDYIYQNNAKKAAAINRALDTLNCDYFTLINADDQLTDDALTIFMDVWESISVQERDNYWCICTHCIDLNNKKIIGDKFPPNANEPRVAKKLAYNTVGEKHAMNGTRAFEGHRFPLFEGQEVVVVHESILWYTMSQLYSIYFLNNVTRLYYTDNPCNTSTAPVTKKRLKSKMVIHSYMLNDLYCKGKYPIRLRSKSIALLTYHGIRAREPYLNILARGKDWKCRLLMICVTPPVVVKALLKGRVNV